MKVKLFVLLLLFAGCNVDTNLLPKFSATPIMESSYPVQLLEGFSTQKDREDNTVLSSVYRTQSGLQTNQRIVQDTNIVKAVVTEYLNFEGAKSYDVVKTMLASAPTQARSQVEKIVGKPLGDFLIESGLGLDNTVLEVPTAQRDSTVTTEVAFVNGVGNFQGRALKIYNTGGPGWEMKVDTFPPTKLYLVNRVFTNRDGTLQMPIK